MERKHGPNGRTAAVVGAASAGSNLPPGLAGPFQARAENVTVQKRFNVLGDRLGMSFRWEVHGLFNRKTWSDPVSLDLANKQSGKITGAGGTRAMQAGLKLQW